MINYTKSTVATGDLTPHPELKRIYELHALEDLKESIEAVGLQQPIIINSAQQILVGRRRWEALKLLGWDKIEVLVAKAAGTDWELEFILESNRTQRQKSIQEYYNEIVELKKIWQKKAGERTDRQELTPEEKMQTDERITKYLNGNREGLKWNPTKVNNLIKIGENKPELLTEIDKGAISINKAYQECRVVDLQPDKKKTVPTPPIEKNINTAPYLCQCPCGCGYVFDPMKYPAPTSSDNRKSA